MRRELRLRRGVLTLILLGVTGLAPWGAVSTVQAASATASNGAVMVTVTGEGVLGVTAAEYPNFTALVSDDTVAVNATLEAQGGGRLVNPSSGSSTTLPFEYEVEFPLNREEEPSVRGWVDLRIPPVQLHTVVITAAHGDVDHGTAKDYTVNAYDQYGNDITGYCNIEWKIYNAEGLGFGSLIRALGASISHTWNIELVDSRQGWTDYYSDDCPARVYARATFHGQTKWDEINFRVNKGTITNEQSWYEPISDALSIATQTNIGAPYIALKNNLTTPLMAEYSLHGEYTVEGSVTTSGSASAKVGTPAASPYSASVEVTVGVSGSNSISQTKGWTLIISFQHSYTNDIWVQVFERYQTRTQAWEYFSKREYSTGYELLDFRGTVNAVTEMRAICSQATYHPPQN